MTWQRPRSGSTDFRIFYTRIVGHEYANRDGTSRQELLRTAVHAGDPLRLVQETQNPEAVRVSTHAGEQLGYLEAKLAIEVRRLVQEGRRTFAFAHEVTGGTDAQPSLGLLLRLVEGPARAPASAFALAGEVREPVRWRLSVDWKWALIVAEVIVVIAVVVRAGR